MKGQRLFIRPLEPRDSDDVRRFLGRDAPAGSLGAEAPSGLLGKLVGELVAVVVTSETSDSIRIDELLVAPELRRKRVGRFMVDELARLAAAGDRDLLVVEEARDAAAFLRKVGFVERERRWERRVR